jgi:exonuclease III
MNETGLSLRRRTLARNKDKNMALNIGTWNVRTLLQARAMNGIADGIMKYRMEIVAIQEIRWKSKGVINKAKFSIYYVGKDDRQGECGVGFIVTRQMRKAVLAFTPVCERICTLRVPGKFLEQIILIK